MTLLNALRQRLLTKSMLSAYNNESIEKYDCLILPSSGGWEAGLGLTLPGGRGILYEAESVAAGFIPARAPVFNTSKTKQLKRKMATVKSLSEFLREGKNYLEKGDPVQASEKLYKAAEEAVKVLALTHAPEVHKEAEKRGRWTSDLLFEAAGKMGREVRHCWDSAWTLHVQGFHEMKLNVNSVEERVEDIAELVRLAEDKKFMVRGLRKCMPALSPVIPVKAGNSGGLSCGANEAAKGQLSFS